MKSFNKVTLPPDFAQQLLDNEIELKLADRPPQDVICNLIELYSKGVEYYESIKSYKYLYFKKKMTEIFTNQTFTAKESNQENKEGDSPITKKLKSKNNQERLQALKVKQQQQKLQKQLLTKTQAHETKKEASKLLKIVEQKQKMLEKHIKTHIQSQDKALEEKLRQRKKRSFCKSFSAYGLTQSTQTKQSLFNEQPLINAKLTSSNDKGVIEPLIVNFESVIQDEQSDEQKEVLRHKSFVPRGKMASMGKLVE